MAIKRNIAVSLILHTAMIVVIFSINDRERAFPLPKHYMLVSLVKEFSGEKFFSVSQNYNEKGRAEQIKVVQKRRTPSYKKSPSRSLRMSDDSRLKVTGENKQDEEQDDRLTISYQ